MKTPRLCLLLLAVSLCPPIPGFGQSNAKPDYYHQHKDADNYQKRLIKKRQKQEKKEAKAAQENRKRHQR